MMIGYSTLVYRNINAEDGDDGSGTKYSANVIDMQKSSVVIVAGATFLLGIILISFAIMFLSMGINPELTKREIQYTEMLEKNAGKNKDFYDRRDKTKNCHRICKSKFPLMWLLPF